MPHGIPSRSAIATPSPPPATWDLRHLSLQDALLWVLRTIARLSSAQVAKGNMIGSAACTDRVLADGMRAYKRLDLWVPGYV